MCSQLLLVLLRPRGADILTILYVLSKGSTSVIDSPQGSSDRDLRITQMLLTGINEILRIDRSEHSGGRTSTHKARPTRGYLTLVVDVL
jgi:hypothetical protein